MRFKNTAGLFGQESGVGTSGEFECDLCDSVHNKGANDDNMNLSEYTIKTTHFAGLEICEDCFERIEESIWRRREDVIKWLLQRLTINKTNTDNEFNIAQKTQKALDKTKIPKCNIDCPVYGNKGIRRKGVYFDHEWCLF